MKVCKACGEEKALEEFDLHPLGREGRHSRCKSCRRIENAARWRANKERYAQNRTYSPAKQRQSKYGISSDEYEAMLERQNSQCAICKKNGPLCVDHDHGTGEVRGLLCANCNKAIGLMYDDTAALQNAIEYLVGWRRLV